MPLYNFKEMFVPYIEDGSKAHTIRAIRKHPAKPGDTLYLYTGLRTKHTKQIIEPQECTAVKTIFIFTCSDIVIVDAIFNGIDAIAFTESYLKNKANNTVKWKILNDKQKNALALADGFYDVRGNYFDLMFKFWQQHNEIPFAGHIICWHTNPKELIYL